MDIELNGQPHPVTPGSDLLGLLRELGFAERKVAVAINRYVIPMSNWQGHALQAGDRVEIIQAISGG